MAFHSNSYCCIHMDKTLRLLMFLNITHILKPKRRKLSSRSCIQKTSLISRSDILKSKDMPFKYNSSYTAELFSTTHTLQARAFTNRLKSNYANNYNATPKQCSVIFKCAILRKKIDIFQNFPIASLDAQCSFFQNSYYHYFQPFSNGWRMMHALEHSCSI